MASKLGVYRVYVMNGQVESVIWSLDGKSTEGGFDADAWGADQLGEMVRIASVTNDPNRFQRKARGEEPANSKNGGYTMRNYQKNTEGRKTIVNRIERRRTAEPETWLCWSYTGRESAFCDKQMKILQQSE